jgi:hypothetical protein
MKRRAVSGPGLQEVVVIAFAADRVARAVSLDEISAPLRERVRGSDQASMHRMRRLVADLVDCPVCTGWWSSLALSMMWPGRYRLRRGLSVAGVQVMLTLFGRLVSEQGRVAIRQAEVEEPEVDRVVVVADAEI